MGGLPTSRTVNGFAVNPEDPKIMFVAMRDGLFKSTDAGASWKVVGNELKKVAAVTINSKKPTEMYLSTMDGTIYVSADAGMKWKKQR
ncbi:MAG: hypothetical protein A2038_01865 [Deltaproteobacteria bacterium GWA2_57_13]|nr:MAG: hypothetical protein A2038_01865 [Deltaproteobacteria bacterium GWA2_57_13]OGQ76643.1 MAG: hypothetical protein A3G40_11905 [Deltaproteobacteria bacterium RIFCSPLOWO2_12_FULL_57_22]